MNVMDDLLSNIDRGAIEFERFFNGYNGAINAGAVSAGRSKENSLSHGMSLLGSSHVRNFK
jgi:hypothetical protein